MYIFEYNGLRKVENKGSFFYSFLKNVLGMFEKYNRNINDYKNSVYTGCDLIKVHGVENASIYNEFCAKLMRNIRLIDDPSNVCITEDEIPQECEPETDEESGVSSKHVHCSYLNKWIYYNIHEKPVPEKIIKEIFRITHNMLNANNSSYKCKFESINEDYLDPYNVIKLSFFVDNFHTISEILGDKSHRHYDACDKYIRDCVNIYKKIKKEHCTVIKRENKKCVTTCEVLKNFKNTYESDIYNLLPQKDEVLNLNSEKMDPEVALQLNGDGYSVESSEQLSGTLRSTITTGAAAAAGTGALLLALNKFTPVGSWLRSGKRRTPEVENILEEGPSEELFLNDPDYIHMNSDTTSYNVGYGPKENY
ncbi:PIR protein [Plasmodium vivax]|uniref:VIR protein n=1 Tax=Plasmodium vivax TaxID=5855 RepID=A0A564ZVY0_PLAVI|nr:PIR protein [Plasmodium vivax]